MKYILNELLDPGRLIFYVLFGFALSFGPWVTMTHFMSTLTTVLGAYLVLVLWIIARTCWLTFYRRSKRNSDKM